MGSGDVVLEAVCVVFGLERALEEIASEEAELYEEARESPNQFQNDQRGPEISQQFFRYGLPNLGLCTTIDATAGA